MAEQWDDLYFRHNFADTGLYPTPGALSASPDVIPLGSTPVSEPSDLIADANWMRDFGSSTNALEANYVYLRGRNLSSVDTEGELYLYYSPASLLLWPHLWSRNALKTSNGRPSVSVRPGAGARFVTPEPFLWIPQQVSNDFYSLIGRVSTERHPNPIPDIRSITDFAAYISQHPDMAWRNVVTVNPNQPVITNSVQYDQGSEGCEVFIVAKCENAPDGSRIEFSAGTPGPRPMIKASGIVKNAQTPYGPSYNLAQLSYIPANWSSTIVYTWHSEGKVPLPGMKISIEAIMTPPLEHPVLAAAARPLTEFGIHEQAIPKDGPQTGIRLGTSRMETLPVAVNAAFAR
jgi:hypothetical protein